MAQCCRKNNTCEVGPFVYLPLSILGVTGPKYVLHQLGMYIRKFLWEGGKVNKKKYHLVNWKIVRAPRK